MSKNQKGSNERQMRNKAKELLAMPEDERNSKLALLDIVKPDQAPLVRQWMVKLQQEETTEKASTEVTVTKTETVAVEQITEASPETIPSEEKVQQEEKPVEVAMVEETIKTEPVAEVTAPAKNPGQVLWEGKKEEPKKERREKKNKITMLRSKVVRNESVPERKAYIVSLEEIMNSANGDGHVNAVYTAKKGIEMSISTHAAFTHRQFGEIIPIIIQKSTVPNRRQPSRKLEEKDVGSWVRLKVPNWKDGIWMIRIGHTNILSDSPLNVNKDIVGLALISSKKVEQKGRNTQYFPHIIVLNTQDNIRPAFSLSINDEKGNAEASGQVHIGPTVSAMRDDQEVREYLHLEPCEQ